MGYHVTGFVMICRWREEGEKINYLLMPKAEQTIDMRATDKSRCFARMEFSNCFIILLQSSLEYFIIWNKVVTKTFYNVQQSE